MSFLKPAGTSRGVLREKDAWFIRLHKKENPEIFGLGECPLIPGLSPDNTEDFETTLACHCRQITSGEADPDAVLPDYPAIQFGLETALLDLRSGGKRILFSSDFTEGKRGIPINGLIWMGEKKEMLEQVAIKIDQGYSILKLKVGAIKFQDELDILQIIREQFNKEELEIRLDANGAWKFDEAKMKLDQLSIFDIHSIEQPIAAGFPKLMARICTQSPIPIVLDEELIGIKDPREKKSLLTSIHPDYIILKPSLLGGFQNSEEWIHLATKNNIGWWVTSALESNIGLNAIAQWTASLKMSMPQGLGTGSLFSNNIPSPLEVIEDKIFYLPEQKWDISTIKFK